MKAFLTIENGEVSRAATDEKLEQDFLQAIKDEDVLFIKAEVDAARNTIDFRRAVVDEIEDSDDGELEISDWELI